MANLKYFYILAVMSIILTKSTTVASERVREIEKSLQISNANKNREPRLKLLSFDAIGQSIALGLDVLLPFLRMPLKKAFDKNGNPTALININTAAIALAGVFGVGGMLISYLFKIFGLQDQGRETKSVKNDDENNENIGVARWDTNSQRNFKDIFEPFKLVYRNSTGEKVSISMLYVINAIEETFLEKNINLTACTQKSICRWIYTSKNNVRNGSATSLQKVIDGLSNTSWIMEMLQQSVLGDAIKSGYSNLSEQCNLKYLSCKWIHPEKKLFALVTNYVKFI